MLNNNSPRSCVAAVGVIVAVLWSLLGSWLTANEFVILSTEFEGYNIALIAAVIGGLFYFRWHPHRSFPARIAIVLGIVISIIMAVTVYRWSDDAFIFWKTRVVRPATWRQMISDLMAIDRKAREKGENIIIHHNEMPKNFQALGLPSDFMIGNAGVDGNPTIMYGVKSRRWGLVIGSRVFSGGLWASFKRVQVGQDAWFFTGPG